MARVVAVYHHLRLLRARLLSLHHHLQQREQHDSGRRLDSVREFARERLFRFVLAVPSAEIRQRGAGGPECGFGRERKKSSKVESDLRRERSEELFNICLHFRPFLSADSFEHIVFTGMIPNRGAPAAVCWVELMS
ncbi:unnamed protein product [Amoebophrya sp. A120]|nr:unnamed protein product [Amoebophrya sp. A120]|eukprot:GSA120T00016266001.1